MTRTTPTTMKRQQQALAMRLAGATTVEIAEKLGYADHTGASRAVRAALRDTMRPGADELRLLFSRRYECLLAAVWPYATDNPPDLKSVEVARKILSDLADLHLPVKIDPVTSQRSEVDDDLDRLVKEIERRNSVITGTVVTENE